MALLSPSKLHFLPRSFYITFLFCILLCTLLTFTKYYKKAIMENTLTNVVGSNMGGSSKVLHLKEVMDRENNENSILSVSELDNKDQLQSYSNLEIEVERNDGMEAISNLSELKKEAEAFKKTEVKRKVRPNILFLVADDMRPEVGVYGKGSWMPWLNHNMETPALDRLAGKSLLFRSAYCQQAWCNPSRTSFLTSRRPDTTMVHNNSVFFRQNHPEVVTMPQYFKDQGYKTLGFGKVFHLLNTPGDHDDAYSWSEPMFRVQPDDIFPEGHMLWHAVKQGERKGKPLLDEFVTSNAIEGLRKVAPPALSGQQPFFLAVGMKKPHLPFIFPEEYLSKYPLDDVKGPENPHVPANMPAVAWATSNEVSGRLQFMSKHFTGSWNMNSTFPLDVIKEWRRAYYSSISYIDDLIGQILDELDNLQLANNTIVTFIGDHGYHLGEHGIFGKNTNFEVASHSPMMIRVPGVTDRGMITDKLVEFVDIFPTLVQLTGHKALPVCPKPDFSKPSTVGLCTEGSSLLPLFRDPTTLKWKDTVFFQYPRHTPEHSWCMGYSIRTQRYRYTEWVRFHYQANILGPDWSETCGVELYDHALDPHETNNIAADASSGDVVKWYRNKVRRGWHPVVTMTTKL